MKTLYIVRHAKSAWDQNRFDDHDRPLLEKGKKRTKKIIDNLLDNHVKIDLIMSSDAVRAKDTASIFAKGLEYPKKNIQLSSELYLCEPESLINNFYDLSDKVGSLMIVGHNPTMTTFANLFLEKKIEWLPTSGVVCIEFDADKWEKVMSAGKKTKFVISPRMQKSKKKGN
ncbi:MAG: histidine phosphatase family protein [Bacteroidetes bacterium]|nr:histidine phosphatase family protein [Bacteroidota bacterium]